MATPKDKKQNMPSQRSFAELVFDVLLFPFTLASLVFRFIAWTSKSFLGLLFGTSKKNEETTAKSAADTNKQNDNKKTSNKQKKAEAKKEVTNSPKVEEPSIENADKTVASTEAAKEESKAEKSASDPTTTLGKMESAAIRNMIDLLDEPENCKEFIEQLNEIADTDPSVADKARKYIANMSEDTFKSWATKFKPGDNIRNMVDQAIELHNNEEQNITNQSLDIAHDSINLNELSI